MAPISATMARRSTTPAPIKYTHFMQHLFPRQTSHGILPVLLGKQQLPHIGGLTIHRDGDHQLAAPLEPSGQSHIHLVEACVGTLWPGIGNATSDIADLDR